MLQGTVEWVDGYDMMVGGKGRMYRSMVRFQERKKMISSGVVVVVGGKTVVL